MSKVIERKQCPACASRGQDTDHDNLAVYDDGHSYCYACKHYENDKKKEIQVKQTEKSSLNLDFLSGTAKALSSRKIDLKTARLYGYLTHSANGKRIELSSYYNQEGKVVAQKLRGANKSFQWRGDSAKPQLFGQQLWKNKGGKRIVVTEGEYDCLTVSQLLDNRWAVVSLPNGAAGAVKSVRDNLEFLSSYEEIILMFDMDEPGRDASQAVAEILPPGKCKIANLPFNDANECLLNNEGKAVIQAMWEAPRYSPDEILHVSSVIEACTDEHKEVYAFPFDSLTEFLLGQRSGEVTLWTSGTGSGKSTILREIMIHHLNEGRSVGAIMLEESPKETLDDLVSLVINKPVRAIRAKKIMDDLRFKLGKEPISVDIIDDLTDEEYAEGRNALAETSLYIYDHLGNSALQNLCARIEFMAVSLGVDVIVLDHITAAATGLMSQSNDYDGGSSERLLIDNIMKELRALVSRTGVHIDVISQLKKTSKAYEEGDRITLQDLRGSGSLSSVPNTVIALERDRQNPDPIMANTTTVRVLKNRLTGRAGVASCLYYDHFSGRMQEIDWAIDDDGNILLKDD